MSARRTPAARHLAFATVLAILGCTGSSAPAADPSVLVDADRAFARAVAEGGTDAWVSWVAADGAQIVPGAGEIRGRDSIRALMAYLDDPGTKLTWEPVRAQIAASGDLGWTTGTYESESVGSDGRVQHGQGRYVTVWRKQDDGSWKVVMDLGNPTRAPSGS
jgi:ketosteroid isomerase-like protein